MKIIYRKRFIRQFKKLPRKHQESVNGAIDLFQSNPFDESLHNHPLRGNLKGKRSISAGFDLRIVFKEEEDYSVVLMLKVGSHEEVYR